MTAQITIQAVGTWLEPYIGSKTLVLNKMKTHTRVMWFSEPKTIHNKYLRFLEEDNQ
jgi:hypothetical protein